LISDSTDVATIDFILYNADGDAPHDAHYARLHATIEKELKRTLPHAVFKHRTGDFHAASALGVALACDLLRNGPHTHALRWLSQPPANIPRAGLAYNLTHTATAAITVISK